MSKIYIRKSIDMLLQLTGGNGNTFLIIDDNLKAAYGDIFRGHHIFWIRTSEELKTMETVLSISEKLLSAGADRNSMLVGIGGGITTDIAGFIASIYKRGIKAAFVPTTLLSQVDASIGGKNGVNFHSYKNILGTITQPEWIYISPVFLRTLSEREFRAGISEVLKTFLIYDQAGYVSAAAYFRRLEAYRKKTGTYLCNGHYYGEETLCRIIRKCAELKSAVVERDQFEKGERRLLNFGHTFGHAIEKIYGDDRKDIMHGEAVSIGMVMAAEYACRAGLVSRAYVESLRSDFSSIGLPVCLDGVPAGRIAEVMTKDKKVYGRNIHLILPEEKKGKTVIKDFLIPLEELKLQ